MKKYEDEYKEAKGDKKKFVKILLQRYKLKPQSARRRFYDHKDVKPKKKKVIKNYEEEITLNKNYENRPVEPNRMKMLMLQDMKQMGYNTNREFLRTYGFSALEINWLEEHKFIELPISTYNIISMIELEDIEIILALMKKYKDKDFLNLIRIIMEKQKSGQKKD